MKSQSNGRSEDGSLALRRAQSVAITTGNRAWLLVPARVRQPAETFRASEIQEFKPSLGRLDTRTPRDGNYLATDTANGPVLGRRYVGLPRPHAGLP